MQPDTNALLNCRRPVPKERCFSSQRIDAFMQEVSAFIPNRELAWMFENCFANTLDTTIIFVEEETGADTFIITGDIPAMWLRDSSAQIWPYLPFIAEDPQLDRLVQGTLNRQARCILLDPYANAFYRDARESPWKSDKTLMQAGVHERKWELDSLGYFMRLSYGYWQKSGNQSFFGALWLAALQLCLDVIEKQMTSEGRILYSFQRSSDIATETLPLSGRGNPIRPCGLVASGFRPSDDACIFPYHIPSNCLVAISLQQMAYLTEELGKPELSRRCQNLSTVISSAIYTYGTGELAEGRVFFYEVDGYGSRLIMDDANIPSLLALPYLGFLHKDDALYQNTRSLVWSEANPYFYRGSAGAGIGGPHIGVNYIWPMSLIMYALTATREEDILQSLRLLLRTHAGTGFMHESFHKDHAQDFTRPWFGWANSLFGELIYELYRFHPDILRSI